MSTEATLSALLDRRRRAHGPEPLLTYYDVTSPDAGSGERTELSATTFGNWVDKTANLLLDLDVGPGEAVRLDLARSHPGHWVTLIWWAACWRAGAEPVLAGPAEVAVIGPAQDAPEDPVVVACSLHPLGLGFVPPRPDPVLDYGVEVRGFADVFLGIPGSNPVPAAAGDPDVRLLLRPGDPQATVADALLRPLHGQGSTVLVVGPADPERLDAIAGTERATLCRP